MAKIMKKEKSLHNKRNENLLTNLFSILAIIMAGIIYFYIKSIFISSSIFIVAMIIFILSRKKVRIYNCGIKGEKKVSKILSKLPKEYMIYNDIKIYNSQIDHLVISPYGIYCIETKCMKGKIIGKEDGVNWIQRKIGKGGGVYDKKFYNPCKQSMGHVMSLKNFFDNHGIKGIWIQSIVVFYGRKTILCVDTEKTPVIVAKKLLKYINNNHNQDINDMILRRIIQIIE